MKVQNIKNRPNNSAKNSIFMDAHEAQEVNKIYRLPAAIAHTQEKMQQLFVFYVWAANQL